MKQTMTPMERLRQQVLNGLVARLTSVMADYDAFTSTETPFDAKAFAAYHAAAKAALSHFEALCKLEAWTAPPSDKAGDDDIDADVEQLLAEAREALAWAPEGAA